MTVISLLLTIGCRLANGFWKRNISIRSPINEDRFFIQDLRHTFGRISFVFQGESVGFSVLAVFAFSLAVGIVSGVYGIDGGAVIAPFCVSVLKIPIFAIAGAVLMANFMTSFAGVMFYSSIPIHNGLSSPPDWSLGILFGIGGLAGMYYGARSQKFIPEKIIKLILAMIILSVATKYIL